MSRATARHDRARRSATCWSSAAASTWWRCVGAAAAAAATHRDAAFAGQRRATSWPRCPACGTPVPPSHPKHALPLLLHPGQPCGVLRRSQHLSHNWFCSRCCQLPLLRGSRAACRRVEARLGVRRGRKQRRGAVGRHGVSAHEQLACPGPITPRRFFPQPQGIAGSVCKAAAGVQLTISRCRSTITRRDSGTRHPSRPWVFHAPTMAHPAN